MTSAAFVRVADRHAAQIGADRVIDIALLDLVKFEIVVIDRQAHARRAFAIADVIIDDVGHRAEYLAEFACDGAALFGICAVDLGEQRRDHGWTRRHFDDLDRCAFRHGQAFQAFAHIQRDYVAGARPIEFREQIDLQIALVGLAT